MNKLVGIVGGLILLGLSLIGVWYVVVFFLGDDPINPCPTCPVVEAQMCPAPIKPEPVQACPPIPEPVQCLTFPVLDQVYEDQRVLRNPIPIDPPEDDKGGFLSWIVNKVSIGYKW